MCRWLTEDTWPRTEKAMWFFLQLSAEPSVPVPCSWPLLAFRYTGSVGGEPEESQPASKKGGYFHIQKTLPTKLSVLLLDWWCPRLSRGLCRSAQRLPQVGGWQGLWQRAGWWERVTQQGQNEVSRPHLYHRWSETVLQQPRPPTELPPTSENLKKSQANVICYWLWNLTHHFSPTARKRLKCSHFSCFEVPHCKEAGTQGGFSPLLAQGPLPSS